MKLNKTFFNSFFIWIISIIVWVLSFVIPLTAQISSIPEWIIVCLVILRLTSFGVGIVSFFIAFITFIKCCHFGKKSVRIVQLIALLTAVYNLIFILLSTSTHLISDNNIIAFLVILFVISIASNFFTVVMSDVIVDKKNGSGLLYLFTLLLSIIPLLLAFLVLFLLGIGFGPPS